MAEEHEALSFAEQETSLYDSNQNEYRNSLCLPSKGSVRDLLQRQTSLRSTRNTTENSQEYLNNRHHEQDEDERPEWIAVESEGYLKSLKVSVENFDCTEDENVECRANLGRNSIRESKLHQPHIPTHQTNDEISDLLETKSKYPEENSDQIQEKHAFDDCTPESLDELSSTQLEEEIKPCLYEQGKTQIHEDLLDDRDSCQEEKTQISEDKPKGFINSSEAVYIVSHDNVDSGDIVKMDGMFPLGYEHCTVVVSKQQNGLELFEYTLRPLSWQWLLILTTLMSLVFLDPLAMLVKPKSSFYTFDKLKKRKARKIPSAPKEIRKYNNIQTLEVNIERRKNEPDFLYSLDLNNCEHMTFFIVFGISKSFQLDNSTIQLLLMTKDLLYYFAAALHLYIGTVILARYCGISWVHTCWPHELYLACYQTYKPYILKKLDYITKAKMDQQISLIWTIALVIPVLALLGGLVHINLHSSPWVLTLPVMVKAVLGFNSKLFAINLKLAWFYVAVFYIVWWNPYGIFSSVLWYIVVSLFVWLIKCTIVYLLLAVIIKALTINC